MGAAQRQGTSVQINMQHPDFTTTYAFTSTQGKSLLVSIPSQETIYKSWSQEVELFLSKDISHEFLFIPQESNYIQGGVCSTSGQVGIRYQYYPLLLTTEIINRKQQSKKYTEAQLWYVLLALASAKIQLAKDSFLVGDIHPNNIFLNQEKNIKVGNLLSWPGEVNNYKKALVEQKVTYLSPQDLSRLKLGSMDNNMNYQSQIFSIGLVVLGCANLSFHEDLYFMQTHQFQEDYFFLRLGKFQQENQYSQILRGIVSNMLEIEPSKRLSLQDIQQFFNKHKSNILAKKALLIDHVPKRLQLTINNMIKIYSNRDSGVQNPIKENHPLQVEKTVLKSSSPKEISYKTMPNIGVNSNPQGVINAPQNYPINNQNYEIPQNIRTQQFRTTAPANNMHSPKQQKIPINMPLPNIQKNVAQNISSHMTSNIPSNIPNSNIPQEMMVNNNQGPNNVMLRPRLPPINTMNTAHGFQEVIVNSPKHAPIVMKSPDKMVIVGQQRMKSPSAHIYSPPNMPLAQLQRPITQPSINNQFPMRQQHIQDNNNQQQQQHDHHQLVQSAMTNQCFEAQNMGRNSPVKKQYTQYRVPNINFKHNGPEQKHNVINLNQFIQHQQPQQPPPQQQLQQPPQQHIQQHPQQHPPQQPQHQQQQQQQQQKQPQHQQQLSRQIPQQPQPQPQQQSSNHIANMQQPEMRPNGNMQKNNKIKEPQQIIEQQFKKSDSIKNMMEIRRSAAKIPEDHKPIIQITQNQSQKPNLNPSVFQSQSTHHKNMKKLNPFEIIEAKTIKKDIVSEQTLAQTSQIINNGQRREVKRQLTRAQQLMLDLQRQEQRNDELLKELLLHCDPYNKNQQQHQNHALYHNNQAHPEQAIHLLKISSHITEREHQNSTESPHLSNQSSEVSHQTSKIQALRSVMSDSSHNKKKFDDPIKIQDKEMDDDEVEEEARFMKVQRNNQVQERRIAENKQKQMVRLQNINIQSSNSIKIESRQIIPSSKQAQIPLNRPNSTKQVILIPENRKEEAKQVILIPENRKDEGKSVGQKSKQLQSKKLQMIQKFKQQLAKKYKDIKVVSISDRKEVNKSGQMSPIVKVWGMSNKDKNKSMQGSSLQINSKVKQAVCLKSQYDKDSSKIQQKGKGLNDSKEAVDQQTGQNNKVLNQIKDILKIEKQKDQVILQHKSNYQQQEFLQNTSTFNQNRSKATQFHTYSELQTDATFQQCWRQIVDFLMNPASYCNLILPEKVKASIPLLEIGPASFNISLNEQQGKILFENNSQSRCSGRILGGIYKDNQQKYTLWVNSSCLYKQKEFPSGQVIGECLFNMKNNLSKRYVRG